MKILFVSAVGHSLSSYNQRILNLKEGLQQNGIDTEIIYLGDYEPLSEKILILARNAVLRREMAKNNIATIRKQYDKKVILQKLQNEYDKLLGCSLV